MQSKDEAAQYLPISKGPVIPELPSEQKNAALVNVDLGLGYLAQGQVERAKSKLNHAITIAPNIPETHSAYIYPFEGSVEIGDRVLKTHQGGVLGSGDTVEIKAGTEGARFLVLAAKPIREPVVQYGPFVMNTHAEIEQAIRDYQSGELTKAA